MSTPASTEAPARDDSRLAGRHRRVTTPAGRPARPHRREAPAGHWFVAVLAFFLSLAASIDFPRTALGFKGDEATYYSLTYSLARDGDMAFKREDLVRVWEEFSAPEGIFLKRGSKLHLERRSGFPFVRRHQ